MTELDGHENDPNQVLAIIQPIFEQFCETSDADLGEIVANALGLFAQQFPDHVGALMMRTIVASQRDDQELTRAGLEHLVALGSQDPKIQQDLLQVYLDQGEFEKVVEFAFSILDNVTDSVPTILRLASALYALDRFDEAIPVLDRSIRHNPGLQIYKDGDFLERQSAAREKGRPAILLNTLFKSASMFIADSLAKGLDLPRCYITSAVLAGGIIIPSWLELFARGGAIAQEHLPPDTDLLEQLIAAGITRWVTHIRDPRQAMISGIHHFAGVLRSKAAIEHAGLAARMPDGFPDWLLPRQIDYYLEQHFPSQAQWVGGWQALAKDPKYGGHFLLTSYEDFHADNQAYFSRLLEFLGLAGRLDWSAVERAATPGKLHFRAGRTDEWKEFLSPGQVAKANAIMADANVEY